jgi:hypothetical protein
MIELIVILVRNLLQIPDMTQNMTAFNEHKRNLQVNFTMKIVKSFGDLL